MTDTNHSPNKTAQKGDAIPTPLEKIPEDELAPDKTSEEQKPTDQPAAPED